MTALDQLGAHILAWRHRRAPRNRDDLTRRPRPPGWLPDCSADAVADDLRQAARFAARLAAVPVTDPADRAEEVDRRVLGSVLARVRWELEILRSWERDPWWYLDHSLGTVFDALLPPPPLDDRRTGEVLDRLRSIPGTLADGRANLAGGGVAEFARLALTAAARADEQLVAAVEALTDFTPPAAHRELRDAARVAADAVAGWRAWLAGTAAGWAPWVPVGAEDFTWFLREVAVVAEDPDELVRASRQEWHRAVAFELLERHRPGPGGRDGGSPAGRADGEGEVFPTPAEQSERERIAELEVRAFYESRDLLTQPGWLRHYRFQPRPPYLEPLAWLGVTDDLTGPDRLGEDAVSYVPTGPGPLPYFYRANAADPRAGIAHEGAHYQQLALAWAGARPLRRHYVDSVPNEGIAFYNEEMLLQAGLWADAPATRAVIYNFLRLRALRVEVDLGLALGRLSIGEAGRILAGRVPMDEGTAREEAAFFASTPGQGMSYLVGKQQVLALLADDRLDRGGAFSLREFHDWLWTNGNVPVALLRWERLGDRRDLDRIDAWRAVSRR